MPKRERRDAIWGWQNLDFQLRAEDGDGMILRLYESRGTRVSATVRADFPYDCAVRTDLLERPVEDPEPAGDVRLALRPFQLVTLRFRR